MSIFVQRQLMQRPYLRPGSLLAMPNRLGLISLLEGICRHRACSVRTVMPARGYHSALGVGVSRAVLPSILPRCLIETRFNAVPANDQRRHIAYIPPLLSLGGKLLATFAAKKIAMVSIVRKLGVEQVFKLIRDANDELLKQGRGAYTPSARHCQRWHHFSREKHKASY